MRNAGRAQLGTSPLICIFSAVAAGTGWSTYKIVSSLTRYLNVPWLLSPHGVFSSRFSPCGLSFSQHRDLSVVGFLASWLRAPKRPRQMLPVPLDRRSRNAWHLLHSYSIHQGCHKPAQIQWPENGPHLSMKGVSKNLQPFVIHRRSTMNLDEVIRYLK